MEKTPDDEVKEALADLASLGRVGHRLAMIDSIEKLQSVLEKLLSRLLMRIGTNHQRQISASGTLKETLQKVHSKLVEILSHVMKRVRDERSCKLNCKSLLDLVLNENNPFTINLSLAFLTLGIHRCDPVELISLLPELILVNGFYADLASQNPDSVQYRSHWISVSNLMVRALEGGIAYQQTNQQYQQTKKIKLTASRNMMKDIHDALENNAIASYALFDILLDILLYQTTTGIGIPPPGCSQAGHERLKLGNSLTSENWGIEMAPPAKLSKYKSIILEWISPNKHTCLFPNDKAKIYVLLLAACGDAKNAQVSHQAEIYLKLFLDNEKERTNAEATTKNVRYYFPLVLELLILCVGFNNALLVTSSKENKLLTLGLYQASNSHRRRMVSDYTFGVMIEHITKLFSDYSQLFESENEIRTIGNLTILAVTKMFGKLNVSTGLTALRAKPYINAANALNSLVIRLLSIGEAEEMVLVDSSLLETYLVKAMTLTCNTLSNSFSIGSHSAMTTEGNVAVRDKLYGIICALSRTHNQYYWLFNMGKPGMGIDAIDTASLLFNCMETEDQNLLPRVTAALDALLAAYCRLINIEEKDIKPQGTDNPWERLEQNTTLNQLDSVRSDRERLATLLLPLVRSASQSKKKKANRFAAARWSVELLKIVDLDGACQLLCFLAGDKDVTVASFARKGLGLEDEFDQRSAKVIEMNYHDETPVLGDFECLVTQLLVNDTASFWHFWDFNPASMASTIAYLLNCLLSDLYGADDRALYVFIDTILKCLKQYAHGGRSYFDLVDHCSVALSQCVSVSAFGRGLLFSSNEGGSHLELEISDIEKLSLTIESSLSRQHLARVCEELYGDVELWENIHRDWLSSIVNRLEQCLKILQEAANEQIGRVHGASFLGASLLKQYRMNPDLAISNRGWEISGTFLEMLGRKSVVSDDVLGKAFVDSLSVALSSPEFLPLDSRLHQASGLALSGVVAALKKYSSSEHVDVSRASKITAAIGICFEATLSTSQDSEIVLLHNMRLQCVDAILSTLGSAVYKKDEGIALQVGEALASYAWIPKELIWESTGKNWPNELNIEFAKTLPPHEQILYRLLRGSKLSSNPLVRTAYAPVLMALVARVTKAVNRDPLFANNAFVNDICQFLNQIQKTFLSLLRHPKTKQLSRESCCIGLAACWKLSRLNEGENEINLELLRAFGQTQNFGSSLMQETRVQANQRRREDGVSNDDVTLEQDTIETTTEIGGASGISEAALGAYREMATIAIELNRPDVLYALFMLSVSHPIWFTKHGRDNYGPSVILGEDSIIGSGSNRAELRMTLRPYLATIMPRLLRASHSPNKQTREQIQTLWIGLTGGGADARLAITQHFTSILDTLLQDTSHKLWRARVGALGAISEIIVGRDWIALGGGEAVLSEDDIYSKQTKCAGVRILKLWEISMRGLDDIRIPVRESAETLARGVCSLTLRLCDPKEVHKSESGRHTNTRDAAAAAATTLRWLLKHGLNQQVPEASGICISCLVGVISVGSPFILQPLIPDMLESLLLALSRLEPAALNYLQVRAAGQVSGSEASYGDLERLRIQAASSSPLSDAVSKLLDLLPMADLEIQRAVVPKLNSTLQLSSGFTSRSAVADACVSLCHSCPDAFKYTGSKNPAVGLLKGFYNSSLREKGPAARSKMTHAFGTLASLCPPSIVKTIALQACNSYRSATGANHDLSIRLSAAMNLRALAVRAQNQFSSGSAWCKQILPVAYLGLKDTDEKIASLWKEVWELGGSTLNLSGDPNAYGNTLEEQLLPLLVKECIDSLNDVSWSRRAAGASALLDLANIGILSPLHNLKSKATPRKNEFAQVQSREDNSHLALVALVRVLSGLRIWVGKIEVVHATVAIVRNWTSSCRESMICMDDGNDLFRGDAWFLQHKDTLSKAAAEASPLSVEHASDSKSASLNFIGLCRLLIFQSFPTAKAKLSVSEDDVLPYRAGVLQSLSDLLNSLDSNEKMDDLKRKIYVTISVALVPIFSSGEKIFEEPPLLVARAIDSIAACLWCDVGSDIKTLDVSSIASDLKGCMSHPAWTVRESVCLFFSRLALKSHQSGLIRHEMLSNMIFCVAKALDDRKFWRVRHSGMQVLHSLTSRTGNITGAKLSEYERKFSTGSNQQYMLEALLPYKEKISQLAKKSLRDPEAKVTAIGSTVVEALSWWP